MQKSWNFIRTAFCRMLLYAVMIALLMPAAAANAETTAAASSDIAVQLVADRAKAGAGGSVSYHLIYHNVTNRNQSDFWLKLNVPEGLEPTDLGGGEWNATLRVLNWKVKEVKGNGAAVIHFNLKIKADVKPGMSLDLTGEAGAQGAAAIKLKPARIISGTQIDQPFFNGYPDGLFHPERNLSRAETAAIVARVLNLEEKNTSVPFSDVAIDHWARSYIKKVAQAGYMQGDEGNRFRPEDPITRAELVTLVLRMRGVEAVPLASFDDLLGHWAKDIVGTAKGLKFIDELSLLFHPNMPIRRDEAAKLINVGLSRGPLEDGDQKVVQHFPDVRPNDWSFGWVEEASMVAHESEVKGNGKEQLIRYLPEQTEPF